MLGEELEMDDRDDKYYLDVAAESGDGLSDDDLARLVEVLKKIDIGEYGEDEDDYETMDPEDFLKKALGEDYGDDDDDEEDDNPWRFSVDDEHDTAWDDAPPDDGGDGDDDGGVDSVGDEEGEGGEESPKPKTVSDKGKKDVKRKSGTVFDRRAKETAGDAGSTQRNIADALEGLRF